MGAEIDSSFDAGVSPIMGAAANCMAAKPARSRPAACRSKPACCTFQAGQNESRDCKRYLVRLWCADILHAFHFQG